MGHRKKLRILIGIIKDKTSIIKATLATKRHTSKVHIAVLRATTHDGSALPSDSRMAAILSLGHSSIHVACTCVEVLMDRLHGTKNASVALKCLFTMHVIITQGSSVLNDQLSVYPSFGGRNFLNLTNFRDDSSLSDEERWDLSSWVRWYASVIEQNLSVSRSLNGHNDNHDRCSLFGELDVLVDFVEVISDVPDSLHLQMIDLVHEIVKLVSDDYRSVQREIFIRIVELRDRIPNLSFSELTQLVGNLSRFVDCKERLCLLFVNRNRNDALWELVTATKIKGLEMMKEKGKIKLLEMGSTNDFGELIRLGERPAKVG